MSASYLKLAVVSITLKSWLFAVGEYMLIKWAENYFSPTSPKKTGLKYLLISSLFLLQYVSVCRSQTPSSIMSMKYYSLLPFSHQLLCNFSHNSLILLPIRVHKVSTLSFSSVPQNHICCVLHTHTRGKKNKKVLDQSATYQRLFSYTNDCCWYTYLAHVF